MEPYPEVNLIKDLVKAMVVHEDAIKIVRSVDEQGVLLRLGVHKDDMGRLMGRGGQTVQAIRLLLRVVGAKLHSVISLKVVEPGESF